MWAPGSVLAEGTDNAKALWQVKTVCAKNSTWSICLKQNELGSMGEKNRRPEN